MCTDDGAFVWRATTVGATEHSAQHGTEFAEDMWVRSHTVGATEHSAQHGADVAEHV